MQVSPEHSGLIRRFIVDRQLAHQMLFAHRHPDATPPFHLKMIDDWHNTRGDPKHIDMMFRESAKSTIAEEATIILALLEQVHNVVILGESVERATERLEAIKNELETNALIEEIFGCQVGPIWQATKVVLPNGVCIQAKGAGQAMRGMRHLQWRPDLLVIDDVEGDKDAFTEEQRKATRQWFYAVVVPACAKATMRMAATPLDAESLPITLAKSSNWTVTEVPIKSINPITQRWESSWPARFSLSFINKMEEEYRVTGNYEEFEREYMVRAIADRDRPFKESMLRSEPVVRTWHPVDVMYDPARTVNRTSAMTGKAVWSWVRSRLVVWESAGEFWLPDQIVDDIFKVNAAYGPTTIGVEEDGLNQFILQPIRHRQITDATVLPLVPMKAPRSKLDFIKGLQPFFKAGEVVFVGGTHEELRRQMVNFPTGRKDILNALAYALLLRPGRPIYPEFGDRHVAGSLPVKANDTVWLVVNADEECTIALVCTWRRGILNVHYDYVWEGRPAQAVPLLLKEVSLEVGRPMRALCPPRHFRDYDTLGLRAALHSGGTHPSKGGDAIQGSSELRLALLAEAALQVKLFKASWTVRALGGGYNSTTPERSPYRLAAEALESFLGRLKLQTDDNDANLRYGETPDGRRYLSLLP